MVTVNGGTLEHAWQTAGIYDFVAVLNFPIRRPSSGRGTRFAGWGTIRVDHVPAIPLEDALRLHDASSGHRASPVIRRRRPPRVETVPSEWDRKMGSKGAAKREQSLRDRATQTGQEPALLAEQVRDRND